MNNDWLRRNNSHFWIPNHLTKFILLNVYIINHSIHNQFCICHSVNHTSTNLNTTQSYISTCPNCPGQEKVRFGQAFWETKKWQLPESGKLKVYCGHLDFQCKKKILFFFLGQVTILFGQVLFIKFKLYLPEWTSGYKNLYSASHKKGNP